MSYYYGYYDTYGADDVEEAPAEAPAAEPQADAYYEEAPVEELADEEVDGMSWIGLYDTVGLGLAAVEWGLLYWQWGSANNTKWTQVLQTRAGDVGYKLFIWALNYFIDNGIINFFYNVSLYTSGIGNLGTIYMIYDADKSFTSSQPWTSYAAMGISAVRGAIGTMAAIEDWTQEDDEDIECDGSDCEDLDDYYY